MCDDTWAIYMNIYQVGSFAVVLNGQRGVLYSLVCFPQPISTAEIFWLQSWFSRFWRHIRSQWRGAPSSRHPAAENYIFSIKRIMFDTIMNLFWTQIDKDINLTKKMFSSPILTHPSVCSDVRASPEHFEVKSWSWVTHRYISIFIVITRSWLMLL